MSRSSWLPVFAVIGLAFKPIGDGCNAEPGARQTGEIPNQNVQPHSVAPLDLSPLYQRLERIDKSIEALKPGTEPADEHRRAESDLKAQEEMATWTRVMAYIAGVSVLVSAIGVGFIVLTIMQNQNSLRVALAGVKRASVANALELKNAIFENRPWIDFELVGFERLLLDQKTPSLAILPTINTGRSIAFNCVVRSSLYEGGTEQALIEIASLKERLKTWSHPGFCLIPGKKKPSGEYVLCPREVATTLDRSKFGAISICVVIRYSDYDGKSMFFTTKNYLLFAADGRMVFRKNGTEFLDVRAVEDSNRTTYT